MIFTLEFWQDALRFYAAEVLVIILAAVIVMVIPSAWRWWQDRRERAREAAIAERCRWMELRNTK